MAIPESPNGEEAGGLGLRRMDELIAPIADDCKSCLHRYDCCGKSREEVGRKLVDVCSGCKKAYYCGRECQVKQWKARHKKYCRKPGEFKAGDYTRLSELLSKPELNGTLVEVVGEDPKTKGHWQVKLQTTTFSVASEKMDQLRPLK